jgi:glycosyltransferase involved in cell wall biosynthesis
MIGTRGVPAKYGGFETAIEEIGARLVERGHKVDVYCRNPEQDLKHHLGMRLINLPAVRKRSLETLSHTGLSVAHAVVGRPDAAIVFNAANAPYLPLLRAARIPAAVHMDGLEWKREKWAGAGARYYKRAEEKAARSGLPLIADARGIAEHLHTAYGRDSHFIPYGAPILDVGSDKLADQGLKSRQYHLVVARMEPENHVADIVEGYVKARSRHPLVVVGSAPYGNEYMDRVRKLATDGDVHLLGGVWDQDLLNQLYANSLSYLHGHSVGGTNPSLLRALGCGAPVTAYDVNFNREVTAGHARFFGDADSVSRAIVADDQAPDTAIERGMLGKTHAAEHYRWDDVTDKYEQLLVGMARR